jgi:peptidoglycan/LPS O-acetylase OafA/YrhL
MHRDVPADRVPDVYPARFGVVDALRGLAALAVVLAHLKLSNGSGDPQAVFPFGYEAVLVFFVISGYCIAASAHGCIQRGFAFRDFMWRRVKRIYPPYLCAIAFWAATRIVKHRFGGEWTLDRTPTEWLQNISLTQWVSLIADPLNAPAANPRLFVAAFWSLCYEEQFYLVIAALLALRRWFPEIVFRGALVLAGLGIAWGAVFPTVKFGVFIEYWAAFATGLLAFYRLCVVQRASTRQTIDLALFALALAAGMTAWCSGIDWGAPARHGDDFVISWSSLAIASAVALGLILLRPFDARYMSVRFLAAPLGALATISYSLYLTHQFCLVFASGVSRRAVELLGAPPSPVLLIAGEVAVLLAIAGVFWYLCERPFLNKRSDPAPRGSSPGRGSPRAPSLRPALEASKSGTNPGLLARIRAR